MMWWQYWFHGVSNDVYVMPNVYITYNIVYCVSDAWNIDVHPYIHKLYDVVFNQIWWLMLHQQLQVSIYVYRASSCIIWI